LFGFIYPRGWAAFVENFGDWHSRDGDWTIIPIFEPVIFGVLVGWSVGYYTMAGTQGHSDDSRYFCTTSN